MAESSLYRLLHLQAYGRAVELTKKVLHLCTQIAATYEFVSLLARQRKDVPYTIYFLPLLQEIGLYHAYKKDKSRTYKQFIKTVEDAIQCSILQSYEIKNDYAGKPSKCTFYLNQDYGKVQKEIPTTKDADTPKKK